MANSTGKTPVSCLQEYLVSKQMIPHYEVFQKRMGTHNPEFTYRVQVGGLWEEGTGRSKQEAKHRAAEKMLKNFKINGHEKMEKEEFDDDNPELGDNFVGLLKELCFVSKYPEPKYYLEEAAGPSHSRVFKMICCVSQLQDFGISKTKKQAKQQAAYKMFQRLKELGIKKTENVIEDSAKRPLLKKTDEEVVEKYNCLKLSRTATNKDSIVFYKDHHKAYIELLDSSPTLTKVLQHGDMINIDNSLEMVEEISRELEVSFTTKEIPGKTENRNYTLMLMSVFPPIAAVGLSEKEAAFNLLNSLMILCS